MTQYQRQKSTYTHTHPTRCLIRSLTPKRPRSGRVDTKQLKILPAHMSGILWVQLLSPEAASASLCQRNSGPHSQSQTITVFANDRAVNECPAPHHNHVIASMALIQTTLNHSANNCSHVQLKRGQFHCLWYLVALCPWGEWNPSLLSGSQITAL